MEGEQNKNREDAERTIYSAALEQLPVGLEREDFLASCEEIDKILRKYRVRTQGELLAQAKKKKVRLEDLRSFNNELGKMQEILQMDLFANNLEEVLSDEEIKCLIQIKRIIREIQELLKDDEQVYRFVRSVYASIEMSLSGGVVEKDDEFASI